MEIKEQKIKNKVLDLFYINGNIAVNIDDMINNYNPEQTLLDKKILLTSIKNHRENYNEILSEIVAELEKAIKELEDGHNSKN